MLGTKSRWPACSQAIVKSAWAKIVRTFAGQLNLPAFTNKYAGSNPPGSALLGMICNMAYLIAIATKSLIHFDAVMTLSQ